MNITEVQLKAKRWRENMALELNVPKYRVMPDAVVYDTNPVVVAMLDELSTTGSNAARCQLYDWWLEHHGYGSSFLLKVTQ